MNITLFRSSFALMACLLFAYCGVATSLNSILCDSDNEDTILAPFSFGRPKDLHKTSTQLPVQEDIEEETGKNTGVVNTAVGNRPRKRRRSTFKDDNDDNMCGACAKHDKLQNFTSKQQLWEHVVEEHIPPCKGTCPWQGCNYAQSSYNIRALKHHVDSEHVGYYHLECPYKCGMRFSWPSNLAAHEKTCGPDAGTKTQSKSNLKEGRKKKSEEQQGIISAWRCPDCRLVVEENSSEHRLHGNNCAMKRQASTEKGAMARGSLGRTQQSSNGQSTMNHQDKNSLIDFDAVPEIIDLTKKSSPLPLNFYCRIEDKTVSCQEVFSTKAELLDHVKKVHYLSCGWPGCGYGPFDDTDALLRHIMDWHQAS